jgi:UDP-glucose 4-epimerase
VGRRFEPVWAHNTLFASFSTYTSNMTSPRKWIITGGAGYIGTHIADEFLANGLEVILYDNFSHGLDSRIDFLKVKYKRDIPMIVGDIRDSGTFENVLHDYQPFGVIHSAALKSVSKSIEAPDEYFEINHLATKNLLRSLSESGVNKIIFSSTAAVYGSPTQTNPIDETYTAKPISPYGESKLAAEAEVNKFISLPGNYGTSLRFFNVVGSAAPELTDNSTENLVPIVFNKLRSGQKPVIYGTDYATPDGTCVRDYVDVRDVAIAHLRAANSLNNLPLALNVGTGHGVSVREAIKLIGETLGESNLEVLEAERRSGDAATLTAQVNLIRNTLGFEARYSFQESLNSLNRVKPVTAV